MLSQSPATLLCDSQKKYHQTKLNPTKTKVELISIFADYRNLFVLLLFSKKGNIQGK